jgi:hypothetical protein
VAVLTILSNSCVSPSNRVPTASRTAHTRDVSLVEGRHCVPKFRLRLLTQSQRDACWSCLHFTPARVIRVIGQAEAEHVAIKVPVDVPVSYRDRNRDRIQ